MTGEDTAGNHRKYVIGKEENHSQKYSILQKKENP